MAEYPDIKAQHEITVRTDRLVLRPVAVGDLAALHQMRLSPTVMQFM